MQGDAVTVSFEKSQVTGSPTVDADGELSQDEEARLYSHYGMSYGESQSDSGLPEGGMATAGMTGTTRDVDVDRTREVDVTPTVPSTPARHDDDTIIRSEEELRVGVARREVGRARLRKYIVAEPVQETVTVQHEEVHIEREQITEADLTGRNVQLGEEQHEVTLSAEEAVVEKRVVPKEKVHIEKEVVTEQQTVRDEVRKEVVEADVPQGTVDRGDLGGRDRI